MCSSWYNNWVIHSLLVIKIFFFQTKRSCVIYIVFHLEYMWYVLEDPKFKNNPSQSVHVFHWNSLGLPLLMHTHSQSEMKQSEDAYGTRRVSSTQIFVLWWKVLQRAVEMETRSRGDRKQEGKWICVCEKKKKRWNARVRRIQGGFRLCGE